MSKIDKKQLILDTALELFIRNGVHQTTTAEISKKAGIAAGTLFNYFKTKEELFQTLYLNSKKELFRTLTNPIKETEDIYYVFELISKEFIKWGLANIKTLKFFMQMEDSPIIPDKLKEEVEELGVELNKFVTLVVSAQKEGKIKTIPVELLLQFFYRVQLSTIIYLAKQKSLSKSKQNEVINKTVDFLLSGLKT